jgi:hypothetical protein
MVWLVTGVSGAWLLAGSARGSQTVSKKSVASMIREDAMNEYPVRCEFIIGSPQARVSIK